jgi:hypothetical protein
MLARHVVAKASHILGPACLIVFRFDTRAGPSRHRIARFSTDLIDWDWASELPSRTAWRPDGPNPGN